MVKLLEFLSVKLVKSKYRWGRVKIVVPGKGVDDQITLKYYIGTKSYVFNGRRIQYHVGVFQDC